MAEQVSEFNRVENKARSIIVAALGATFLLGALAPQNTRAVFIIDGGLPGAKAFTATLGPNGRPRGASYLSGLAGPRGPVDSRYGRTPNRVRSADTPPGAFTRGPAPVVPVGSVPNGANAVAPLPREALADAGLGANTPNGTPAQFTPIISQPVAGGSGVPVGGTDTPGNPGTGNPGTGNPGAGNPGTPGTDNPPPVSAVPEVSTWILLLSGFLMIGATLRNGRRKRADAGNRAIGF